MFEPTHFFVLFSMLAAIINMARVRSRSAGCSFHPTVIWPMNLVLSGGTLILQPYLMPWSMYHSPIS